MLTSLSAISLFACDGRSVLLDAENYSSRKTSTRLVLLGNQPVLALAFVRLS